MSWAIIIIVVGAKDDKAQFYLEVVEYLLITVIYIFFFCVSQMWTKLAQLLKDKGKKTFSLKYLL